MKMICIKELGKELIKNGIYDVTFGYANPHIVIIRQDDKLIMQMSKMYYQKYFKRF